LTIEATGARLQVRREQCGGTPLLLLHGGPGGTDYLFKFFARGARERGFQPVSFIQRGSPGSPSDGPFDVESMVGDVEAVRAFLGAERVAVLGHSWGGLLATCYAAAHPERVEQLVTICPIGLEPGWREEFNATIRSRLTAGERARVEELEAAAARAAGEERGRLMVERAGVLIRGYYSPTNAAGQPGLAGLTWRVHESVLDSIDAYGRREDVRAGLRRIECPVTIFWGLDDPIPSRVASEWGRAMPHAEIVAFPECGHFPWFEVPEQFWPPLWRALEA
jgi:proline iminopeptidase